MLGEREYSKEKAAAFVLILFNYVCFINNA